MPAGSSGKRLELQDKITKSGWVISCHKNHAGAVIQSIGNNGIIFRKGNEKRVVPCKSLLIRRQYVWDGENKLIYYRRLAWADH